MKAAYLKLFESVKFHSMTPILRFAADNRVVDDGVAEATLVGDVETNVPGCPLPSGTRVSLRIVHIFELDDDGRIARENAYELWRRADGPIDDDIPADAPTITFDSNARIVAPHPYHMRARTARKPETLSCSRTTSEPALIRKAAA